VLDLYKFIYINSIVSFEFLNVVFNSRIGFLCFPETVLTVFIYANYNCWRKISETLDLCSLKCYKREKKIST